MGHNQKELHWRVSRFVQDLNNVSDAFGAVRSSLPPFITRLLKPDMFLFPEMPLEMQILGGSSEVNG